MADENETLIRTPFLPNSPHHNLTHLENHEIVPYSNSYSNGQIESEHVESPPPPPPPPPPLDESSKRNQRLLSLDVFRGLTIALMILVDDVGGAFPSINHSPWFGVTIADFVMPFFLFIVGVSVALVFKKVPSKSTATKRIIMRTIKLFLLGIFLQGGYFHGRKDLSYGVDVKRIRWLGVLQRIALGYLLASLSEIWLVNNVVVNSVLTFAQRYWKQWLANSVLCIIYLVLLYGIYVPDWKFELEELDSSLLIKTTQIVHCGVRGSLDPPCNAVGFIDRLLLGESHLYQHPVYRRVKECSENSPDYGPLPPNSPAWCLSPFDPEGILSSLMAAVACFVGLHFGQIIVHFKDNLERILLWATSAFSFIISGFILLVLGMPLSKPLYTLSYMCITTGTSGFVFITIFYLVDIKNIRKPVILLQWMGTNALIVYALAACEIFPAFLQGFYWHSPEINLVDGIESLLQDVFHSKRWGTLTFVILEIIFWGLISGYLHIKHIYIRL